MASLLKLFLLTSFLCISSLAVIAIPEAPKSQTLSIETLLKQPVRSKVNEETQLAPPVKPQDVSEFAAAPFKLGASMGQVPVETRLRISVETPLSAARSIVGEEFSARVLDDFYLQGDLRKLIVPKNTWIRGKVSYIKRPRLLSRSGKLGIKLDSLVTPQGDYVPLDADLVFMAGLVNQAGLLDPQTDFGDKAIVPTKKLLRSDAGKVVSVATFGAPVVGTLLGGSIVALFSHGDAASLERGQELQIMLLANTDLAM